LQELWGDLPRGPAPEGELLASLDVGGEAEVGDTYAVVVALAGQD